MARCCSPEQFICRLTLSRRRYNVNKILCAGVNNDIAMDALPDNSSRFAADAGEAALLFVKGSCRD